MKNEEIEKIKKKVSKRKQILVMDLGQGSLISGIHQRDEDIDSLLAACQWKDGEIEP
jgi:hypothetical protein